MNIDSENPEKTGRIRRYPSRFRFESEGWRLPYALTGTSNFHLSNPFQKSYSGAFDRAGKVPATTVEKRGGMDLCRTTRVDSINKQCT